MSKLKELIFTFSCVVTCTLIASASYISIFWEDVILDVNILWQIIIVSLICCLGNLFYPKEEKSRRQFYTILVIHYLYIVMVVMGCGFYFGWFHINDLAMVLGMLLQITFIFILIVFIFHVRSKKQADRMTKRLQEYIKKDKHLTK